MTTPQMPRRHKVAAFAETNPLMRALLTEVIPQYPVLVAVTMRARERAAQAHNTSPHSADWPTSVEAVTPEWVDQECERWRSLADVEAKRQALAVIEANARADLFDAIDAHASDLIAALATKFEALLDRIADAVAQLRDDVHTAADAINAGPPSTEAWKAIAEMAEEYHDIRTVQVRLYRGTGALIDALRCGDGDPNVTDPEARVYYHRALDIVAPCWRGARGANAVILPATYPWPAGRVERLVWFARSDSGMWCPTPQQLRQHFNNTPAAPLPVEGEQMLRESQQIHQSRARSTHQAATATSIAAPV